MPSLSSKIHSAAKRPNVSAIVIDVLGGVCSVRLSQRGSILRGLSYSGAAPSKGQQVWVDYSRGNPVVVTSSSGGEIPRAQGNGSPTVYASQSGGGGSPPDIPPQTKQGNVYFRGEYSEEEQYLAYDVVVVHDELYGDAFYLCKQDSLGNEPLDDEFWYLWGGGNPPIIDPGDSVLSVTGLNTDNADPQNPVVQISVDGETITGSGTPGDPLVATPGEGGGTPAGDDGEIQFNDDNAFGASPTFKRAANGGIIIGDSTFSPDPFSLVQAAESSSVANFLESFGDDVASYITFVRHKGSKASPTAVTSGIPIGRIRGRANDGSGVPATRAEVRFITTEDWSPTGHGAAIEVWATPNGATDQVRVGTFNSDGFNLQAGRQFFVNTRPIMDGWRNLDVLPTRTAADDPTYTLQFASVDYRSYLAEGTPITWLQNSIVRYGFVNAAPVYSGGNTTITVLTRLDSSSADYDVLDTGTYSIISFSVGLPKQPGLGFPALPQYWTTSLVDSSNQIVSTPGTGIVNPGSLSLVVPIGAWNLEAEFIVYLEYTGTNTRHSVIGGIGASNSSFLSDMQFRFIATSTDIISNGGQTLRKYAHYTSKTTLYLNCQCGTSSPATTAISLRGGQRDTILRAVSAYL